MSLRTCSAPSELKITDMRLVDICGCLLYTSLAPFGVVYNVWTENEEGTYEYSMVSDGMKDALLFMQDLYSEGLVKSDFAVTDILGEEVANGKVGMYYGEGWLSLIHIYWITIPLN